MIVRWLQSAARAAASAPHATMIFVVFESIQVTATEDNGSASGEVLYRDLLLATEDPITPLVMEVNALLDSRLASDREGGGEPSP